MGEWGPTATQRIMRLLTPEPSRWGKANNLANFSSYLERMESNEEIFSRVMTDKDFRSAAHEHLAREIFMRVRGADEGG